MSFLEQSQCQEHVGDVIESSDLGLGLQLYLCLELVLFFSVTEQHSGLLQGQHTVAVEEKLDEPI